MSNETLPMTGVLLAGGRSRRMGHDKRFLELEGHTLLERTLSVLEEVFSDVLVVVADPLPPLASLRHRVVTDLIPHCATLGGLFTGLSYATHPRIFAVACDMPFLNPRVIVRLAEIEDQSDVVMVQLASGLQPMHAIYSKACLPHLERMAKAEALKVQEIVRSSGIAVRLVFEDEIRDLDPQFLSFFNVNTPADLEFARKLLAGQRPHRGATG